MIVVDTSALIAILDQEPDAALYAEAIAEADSPLISAATLLELHIVMLNRHGARAAQIVDRMIQDAGFQIETFTVQHLELAREAYAPPALQSVTRDFAFLVPADLAAGELVRAVRGGDKVAITDARIFDVFAGQGVPEGKKSVAIEVTLQPGEKTFTDAEIKAISDAVVASAAKLGAELRG